MDFLRNILKYPFFYNISQFLLAPGAHYCIPKRIRYLLTSLPQGGRILDIGCGPKSWLWQVQVNPIGIDISYRYSKDFLNKGENAITGSATELPIKDGSIDGIWCIGVLHHLNNDQAQTAITEMLRVVSTKGYIVIIDAVLPECSWKRPIASYIRNLDRGQFMRSQKQLESLLSQNNQSWHTERYTYAATGLELLQCVYFSNA